MKCSRRMRSVSRQCQFKQPCLQAELELMYATSDRRTDDGRRSPLNAPLRGGGIIKYVLLMVTLKVVLGGVHSFVLVVGRVRLGWVTLLVGHVG